MGCSTCEKKRKLLQEQARAKLEARQKGEDTIQTGLFTAKKQTVKGEKEAPENMGPWSMCPDCANYRFYCKCGKK